MQSSKNRLSLIPLALWMLLTLFNCTNTSQENPSASESLTVIDIFGGDEKTALTFADGSHLAYRIDDSNAHYLRFILDADVPQDATIQVTSPSITSIGAFREEKTIRLHPDYPHVYLQKGIPATYYMGHDDHNNRVRFVAVKASGSGLNFFYSSEEADVEVSYDNSITDVALTDDFTPAGADKTNLFAIHLAPDEPITSNFTFALRNDIGSWESLFVANSNLGGEEARLARKFAHYELDNSHDINLGTGRYTYTLDLFDYDPNNLPRLYDASQPKGDPLITKGEKNRSNGYYRLTLRSDNPSLTVTLKNGNKASKAGAFGNGSLLFTPEHAHAFLSEKSSPTVTYYMSGLPTGQLQLTSISTQVDSTTQFSYFDSYLQTNQEVIAHATNSQSSVIDNSHPLMISNPPKGSYHLQSITSDGIVAPQTEIWFATQRQASNNPAKSSFAGESQTEKNASFLMPNYGIRIIDEDATWYYRIDDGRTLDDITENPAVIWQEGANAFGYKAGEIPMSWERLGTTLKPNTYNYLFRYDFSIDQASDFHMIAFRLRNHGIVSLYLNGVYLDETIYAIEPSKIRSLEGFHERSRFLQLPPYALRNGKNTLIVRLNQDPRINRTVYFNMIQFNIF